MPIQSRRDGEELVVDNLSVKRAARRLLQTLREPGFKPPADIGQAMELIARLADFPSLHALTAQADRAPAPAPAPANDYMAAIRDTMRMDPDVVVFGEVAYSPVAGKVKVVQSPVERMPPGAHQMPLQQRGSELLEEVVIRARAAGAVLLVSDPAAEFRKTMVTAAKQIPRCFGFDAATMDALDLQAAMTVARERRPAVLLVNDADALPERWRDDMLKLAKGGMTICLQSEQPERWLSRVTATMPIFWAWSRDGQSFQSKVVDRDVQEFDAAAMSQGLSNVLDESASRQVTPLRVPADLTDTSIAVLVGFAMVTSSPMLLNVSDAILEQAVAELNEAGVTTSVLDAATFSTLLRSPVDEVLAAKTAVVLIKAAGEPTSNASTLVALLLRAGKAVVIQTAYAESWFDSTPDARPVFVGVALATGGIKAVCRHKGLVKTHLESSWANFIHAMQRKSFTDTDKFVGADGARLTLSEAPRSRRKP